MRKYRGRNHKRAIDAMKKFKIKGSVMYCRKDNFKMKYFNPDEKCWSIATSAYR